MIQLKTEEQINAMKLACRITGEALALAGEHIKPGVTTKYIDDIVHPDFRRAVMSFLNYDAIKREIAEGKTPSITYKKVNGETVVLSVYKLTDESENAKETLWVFAKE